MLKGRDWRFIVAVLMFVCGVPEAQAQVAAAGTFLTIGAIRQGLNEALTGVQQATLTAGGEVRASGNSLQGNIQNVLADLDAKFANRFDVTYTKLSGAELQFMSDARELIFRSRDAAKALVSQTGDEARRTIGEADIAAYNTSYSLPCRTQIPRVVYWLPTSQIARGEEAVVEIHGNFLNYGNPVKVLVDGAPAARFTRNDRVISVTIPRDVIQKIVEKSSISILVNGLEERVLEPRMLSVLFGCSENLKPVQDTSVTVAFVPRVSYQIKGEIWATYKEWADTFVFQSGNLNQHDDNCDANREIGFNVCVPDAANMRVVGGTGSVQSKSGNSSWGPPALSGTTCINFPAHLGGGGYNWVLGVKNCQSSAWLNVNWSATAQHRVDKETVHFPVDAKLPVATYSYSVNDAQSPSGEDWRWRFVVQISQLRGSQVIQSEALSDGRLDNGNGWLAAMKDGVLTVTLPSNID